jgi:LPXTG-motif cell wall-anchored protein
VTIHIFQGIAIMRTSLFTLLTFVATNALAHPLPIPHGHEALALSSPWPVALGIAAITALFVLLSRKRSR